MPVQHRVLVRMAGAVVGSGMAGGCISKMCCSWSGCIGAVSSDPEGAVVSIAAGFAPSSRASTVGAYF